MEFARFTPASGCAKRFCNTNAQPLVMAIRVPVPRINDVARECCAVIVDRRLSFQTKIIGLPLMVIVLVAPTNRLPDLRLMLPQLVLAIDQAATGARGDGQLDLRAAPAPMHQIRDDLPLYRRKSHGAILCLELVEFPIL